MAYRIVPDVMRERTQKSQGRPYSQESLDLLAGKTIFNTERKNFGSLYILAKRHNMRCFVRKSAVNHETGYVIWFEDAQE